MTGLLDQFILGPQKSSETKTGESTVNSESLSAPKKKEKTEMTKHKGHATARQRRLALDALEEVAANPDAADHARAAAARALLNSGDKRGNAGDNGDDADEPTPLVLILPDNGRDPTLTRLGITRGEGNQYRIVYDGATPQGLKDLERWQREVDAEIDGLEPPDEPLALPADPSPPKPRPLSGAERQRAYRKRKALQSSALGDLQDSRPRASGGGLNIAP